LKNATMLLFSPRPQQMYVHISILLRIEFVHCYPVFILLTLIYFTLILRGQLSGQVAGHP